MEEFKKNYLKNDKPIGSRENSYQKEFQKPSVIKSNTEIEDKIEKLLEENNKLKEKVSYLEEQIT